MGFFALLRRWLSGSGAAGVFRSACDKKSSGTFRSMNPCFVRESSTNRLMSGVSSSESLPLLMQPPVLEGGDIFYKFRRIEDGRIISFNERRHGGSELVGFSHGWVALFNRHNNDLFLSDPLSNRHIKLPPIHTLPDPNLNLDLYGHGSVNKVILSSSPDDDQECRAMMIFGPAKRLAFCLPSRSSEWTPIGSLYLDEQDNFPFVRFAKVHEDLVYCSKREVFTSITPVELVWDKSYLADQRCVSENEAGMIITNEWMSEIYDWDIQDPTAAKTDTDTDKYLPLKEDINGNGNKTRIWWEKNIKVLEDECIQIPHLVYAEQSDQLFLVLRFVMLMNPDNHGSPLHYIPHCVFNGLMDVFPCKTFGFIVMEINEKGECTILDDLYGMTMFVGINHSFAISAESQFPELKPNSIYFTDAKRIRMMHGLNDNGIFDYENKTVSPCYTCYDSPCSSDGASSAIWFPSHG